MASSSWGAGAPAVGDQLAVTAALDFPHAFNPLAGSYHQLTAGVRVPGAQLGSTLDFMVWPAFAMLFSVQKPGSMCGPLMT